MHNEPTRKGNRSRKALATAQNAKSMQSYKQARPRKATSRKVAPSKAPGLAAASAALSIGQALAKKKY